MHTLYSYHVSTGVFTQLGTTDLVQYIEMADWIDDEHPLIRAGMVFMGGNHEVYVGDVTTNDSLKQIAEQYAYRPKYFLNPARLLWVSFDWAENKEAPRSVKQYEFSSGETNVLWQSSCDHECEATDVVWADNDLLVLLDGYPMSVEFQGLFWSLKTDKLLYSVANTFSVHRLNNQIFLFDTFDEALNSTVFRGVQFQDGTIREIFYPDADTSHPRDIYVSPSKQYLLIEQAGYSTYAADVYDLIEQHRYSLTQTLKEGSFNIHWMNDDSLRVDVVKQDGNCTPLSCILGSWLVRVPDESVTS
jgi:hypothetical protein